MANYVFPRVVYDHRKPTKTDDANQGYVVGQPWADLAATRFWICVRNTPGDAKWIPVGGVENVEDHTTLNIDEYENMLVYCERFKQVFYCDGDIWMLVTFDITKVTTFPDPSDEIWDNKLIYFEPTQDIYYCDGNITQWILVTWRIHNRQWLPSLPDPSMPSPVPGVSYWEGKLCFQISNKKMYYCYQNQWYGMGWSRGDDFDYGESTFVGNNGVRVISHTLKSGSGTATIPGYVNIIPYGNPQGHLGEVWYTATTTTISVGNSGAYTGPFRWFAISGAL